MHITDSVSGGKTFTRTVVQNHRQDTRILILNKYENIVSTMNRCLFKHTDKRHIVFNGERLSCGRASVFRSKGPGFKTTCCRFETWTISFTSLCRCLSEESLKAVGPFYLVSMQRKTPHTGKWKKPVVDSLTLERDLTQINHSYVSSRHGYLELNVISHTSKSVPRYLVCMKRGSSAAGKPEYQSRGPGFEMWAISFTPRCSSPDKYIWHGCHIQVSMHDDMAITYR